MHGFGQHRFTDKERRVETINLGGGRQMPDLTHGQLAADIGHVGIALAARPVLFA